MLPASFWLNALWEDSATLIVAACPVQPWLPLPWWHIKSRWQHKFERALTTVDWGFQPDAWHAERPQPWGWLFHRLWLSFLRGCLVSKPGELTEKLKKKKYIEMLRNDFLRVDSFCLDFSVWNPCGSSLSKAILIGYWFILFILFNTLSRLITKLIFHDFLHFIGHYPCTLRRKNEEQKISRFTYKKEISNHSMRNHRGVNWNKMFHCTSSEILKPQELQCSFAHNNV